MRLRYFMAGAGVITLVGFLGFRILNLEQRVAALTEQLGAPHAANGGAASSGSSAASIPTKGYEQRLQLLERKLDALAGMLQTRQTSVAKEGSPAGVPRDEAILSVVERENSRIRDVQLEWHRGRWMETRQQALTAFAAQLQLRPAQTVELNRALEHEIDNMIDVLKRPELAADPDQAVSDWQAALADTDKRAEGVLTPDQMQVWNMVRLYERRALWPWLPDQAATAFK